jgi:hypothetical protein
MVVISLYDNYPGTFAANAQAPAATGAVRWQSSTEGWITALRWYRATGTTTPTTLRLWDSVTQSPIASVVSVPAPIGTGWQTVALPTPVFVQASREYRTSFFQGASTNNSLGSTSGTTIGAPSPMTAITSGGGVGALAVGSDSYPNGSIGDIPFGVDVVFTDTNPGTGTPPTQADIQNALASWLSTTDGTHADSAPLQDHTTLATVDTNTADVKGQADEWAFGLGAAAHGYYATIQALIDDVKSITDTLPTPIARLSSIVLDHYSADIAGILAQIDSVLSGLGAQSTDLSGTAGSAVGALSGRTGFPATGWSMSASADFEDAIAFAEPADAYVLSITSYQPTQPATESPAGLWLPRLGWWCVLNGSLATQRQFVDFEQMLLEQQGRRMPGCAIQLKPGTLATVQAWVLA